MRLLHVVDSMDPRKGGVSQALNTMANELENAGVENEVLTMDAPGLFKSTANFTIREMGPSYTPWRYARILIPWILQNLGRFDAVIVHGLWLYNSVATVQAFRQMEKMWLATAFDMPRLFVMPHGMLDPYFQNASGRKFKALRNWAYWSLFESKTVNGADGIFFASEEERRLAGKTFKPYRPRKEYVVGLGVEEPPAENSLMQEAFLQKCPDLKHGSYLLFLSRIDEKKGIDLLIDAFAEVSADKGRRPENLVIAGPGMDKPYGLKLKNKVKRHPVLKTSVYFTDMLTGNAKWGALYGCEALILPSHQENFGIAVAEALACAKPVLISNKVNIHAEINSFAAGIITNDDQAGVIELLASWNGLTADQKSTMCDRARKCYLSVFATKPALTRLLAVLKQPILTGHNDQ